MNNFTRFFAIALFTTICSFATASDYSVELFGLSYHQDREFKFNERNYGVGMVKHLNDNHQILAGAYYNSYYNVSKFLAYGVETNAFDAGSVDIRIGAELGVVTGYAIAEYMPMVAPKMTLTMGQVSLVLRSIPGIVSSASLRYRF